MILGFNGLPGQGKTLAMAYWACKALKEGRTVYSNTPIVDNYFKTGRRTIMIEDLILVLWKATNCVICIDETAIVLPAYKWKMIPDLLIEKFAQGRKLGRDIYYTSQSWGHTLVRLRDLTNWSILAENHRLFFRYKQYNPDVHEMTIPPKFKDQEFLASSKIFFPWNIKKLYGCYDTMYQVKGNILNKETLDRLEKIIKNEQPEWNNQQIVLRENGVTKLVEFDRFGQRYD